MDSSSMALFLRGYFSAGVAAAADGMSGWHRRRLLLVRLGLSQSIRLAAPTGDVNETEKTRKRQSILDCHLHSLSLAAGKAFSVAAGGGARRRLGGRVQLVATRRHLHIRACLHRYGLPGFVVHVLHFTGVRQRHPFVGSECDHGGGSGVHRRGRRRRRFPRDDHELDGFASGARTRVGFLGACFQRGGRGQTRECSNGKGHADRALRPRRPFRGGATTRGRG
jgi:hypothetical protein